MKNQFPSEPPSSNKKLKVSTAKPPQRRPKLSSLPTPAFVVDADQFRRNCNAVLEHAQQLGVRLRPHIKTHKTWQGTLMQGGYDDANGESHDSETESPGFAEHVTGFVVSTIPELELLLQHAPQYNNNSTQRQEKKTKNPLNNILYGVPISPQKLSRIQSLLGEMEQQRNNDSNNDVIIPRIHYMMDHPDHLQLLTKAYEEGERNKRTLREKQQPLAVFLKLDTGYHRAGALWNDPQTVELAWQAETSPAVELVGVYTHCGHAYDESDEEAIQTIVDSDLDKIAQFLQAFQERLVKAVSGATSCFHMSVEEAAVRRVQALTVSVGSTPSLFHHGCKSNTTTTTTTTKSSLSSSSSSSSSSQSATPFQIQPHQMELHPGNYTMYDRQQLWSGAARPCRESTVACRVMATVIGNYPDRILLDAGALALSKDLAVPPPINKGGTLSSEEKGTTCSVQGRPDLECYKTSQEMTLVRSKSNPTSFPNREEFPIGSTVFLIPSHSCLAAACFDKYYIVNKADDEQEEENNSGQKGQSGSTSSTDQSLFGREAYVVDEWTPVKFF